MVNSSGPLTVDGVWSGLQGVWFASWQHGPACQPKSTRPPPVLAEPLIKYIDC
jgi:hypothetical protein